MDIITTARTIMSPDLPVIIVRSHRRWEGSAVTPKECGSSLTDRHLPSPPVQQPSSSLPPSSPQFSWRALSSSPPSLCRLCRHLLASGILSGSFPGSFPGSFLLLRLGRSHRRPPLLRGRNDPCHTFLADAALGLRCFL